MNATELLEYRRKHIPVFNDNKMKLGIFGQNCSNGCTISHAETTFEPTYKHSVAISQKADALGFELLVPVGRWRGFGGSTDFNGTCMETYTWATAMATQTRNLMLFSTSHVPTMHPIVAAKQGATIDHISEGRWGLNIVCGWFTPEMEMFGVKQMDHETRYRYAGEWIRVIKRLWTEQHFDHEGEFFRIKDGYLLPKPVQQPYPVLINAGFSPTGREFSAREVDFNFISIDTLDNGKAVAKDVKRLAYEYGREIGMMSYGLVVCRDTEKEAQHAYRYIVEKGDWEATHVILQLLGVESGSFTEQHLTEFAEHFIAGWGGYPMVGTPEQVTEELVKLSQIGIEGMILCWLDYNEEIKYFGERVLPLLQQAGLRK
ncbi:MAG TPA: LLM class flavin-dependent oxidoreductase [Candidatus Binatia bacterium]|nr:LLM class flavin-dependent oxidoreductase [Candidatus Binatia bacterium]